MRLCQDSRATYSEFGKTATVPAGKPYALVATLNRPARAETLSVDLANKAGTFTAGAGSITEGSTIMAFLIPAVFALAGTYTVTIDDAGGNVLSTGRVTVR